MPTDRTAERQLLRDVLTWARANGWRRVEPYPTSWPEWTNFQQDAAPNICLYKPEFSEDYDEIRVYFNGPEVRHVSWRPISVREVIDVLCALQILPPTFSSMYFVGHEDGGNEISDDVIERSVEVQMDALLSRLDHDDTRRALGDWYDDVLVDPPILPDEPPYARRIRLEAIVEGVSEILGVGNAS